LFTAMIETIEVSGLRDDERKLHTHAPNSFQ
jgi:hypothetical protein